MITRKSLVLFAIFFSLGMPGSSRGVAGEDFVAESPEAIRPLLPGASIPDVRLATPDGEPLSLLKLTSEGPLMLVFYRGGW